MVIVVTFLGVTILTLALWLTDPGYMETTPVGDLSFFALGAIIGVGLASQLRRAEQRIAGLQQAGIGILSLGVAGVIGARIEPAIGAVLLLLVVAVLVVLHPARREILAPGPGIDAPVLALSVLAGIPAIGYAVSMLRLAAEAGPSCFSGNAPTATASPRWPPPQSRSCWSAGSPVSTLRGGGSHCGAPERGRS
jgi:hypothetical protein